ncbi:hypothetical protein Tcan_16063 [Toxocara canis]|nr:hypothetical protein Tcan_16063 [Toxocara canis]
MQKKEDREVAKVKDSYQNGTRLLSMANDVILDGYLRLISLRSLRNLALTEEAIWSNWWALVTVKRIKFIVALGSRP